VKDELSNLQTLLEDGGKMVAIVGGKKVSGKIKVITEFLKRGVHVLVGGGMVGTFFKAQGRDVGKSFVEWERLDVAREILNMEEAKEFLHLPVDVGIATEIMEDSKVEYVEEDEEIEGAIVDVGPKTVAEYYSIIKGADRVFWNGPLGIYEIKPFAAGSNALLGFLKTADCFKVAGGGETAMMVAKSGLGKVFDFVSTGGGATLDFLVHGTLPGLEVLKG
jgi:phosphoglycerate kinase